MKNLQNQTKQAFLFSLGFYLLAMMLILFKVSFGPIMFSIALLVSLIWVFMTIREVLISTRIVGMEQALLIFFIILLNIFAGIVYFYLIRKTVIDSYSKK